MLYSWTQLPSKCLLYKLEWSSVASQLSHVGFTWFAHFFLSRGSLEKPYKCRPSLQVGLQPIELSYCLDNSKTTYSRTTLCMLYHTNVLNTPVAILPSTSHVKPRPHRKRFKICFLNNPYLLERKVLESNLLGLCFVDLYLREYA